MSEPTFLPPEDAVRVLGDIHVLLAETDVILVQAEIGGAPMLLSLDAEQAQALSLMLGHAVVAQQSVTLPPSGV